MIQYNGIQLASFDKRTEYFIKNIRLECPRFVCSKCHEILIDPSQTQCGCRFCYSCINKHFASCGNICPNCQTEIPNEIIKDRAIDREISNLEIRCLLNGCDHIGQFKYLDDHLKMCKWRLENCDKCPQTYPKQMKEIHLQEECVNGICKCSKCGLEMTRHEYQTFHVNINVECIDKLCENLSGKCPYECNSEIHNNIRNHLYDCPNKVTKCFLYELGCRFVGNQVDMSKHLSGDNVSHMTIVMSGMRNLMRKNGELEQKIVEANDKNGTETKLLKEENFQLKKQIESLRHEMRINENQIEAIKSDINSYKEQLGGGINSDEDVSIVEGICIWTVRNVRQRITDAKSGFDTQITSKPFYLRQPGYRFSLKVYPNGDGQGKDRFLSIYFIIIKGEYDDELRWPFIEKVNLSLISSNALVQNISILMKPDSNMICYGRPVKEFNLGAGQPEFVNLGKLIDSDDFIHSGSIRIRFEMRSDSDSLRHSNAFLQSVRKIK